MYWTICDKQTTNRNMHTNGDLQFQAGFQEQRASQHGLQATALALRFSAAPEAHRWAVADNKHAGRYKPSKELNMEIPWNSVEEIQKKTQSGMIQWHWPIVMLFSRTFLFFVFGFIILLILDLFQISQPNREVTRWWTYQVISTNVLCFFLLRWLASKEHMKFSDLIGMEKRLLKKDALLVLVLLIPSGIIGYFGVYFAGVWLYGDTPPAFMFQSLPIWAAILSVIFFPLTNALIETATYFGYSFQRIAVLSGNRWLALVLAASFLALQHIGIPLYLDLKYILWRFLSFLPFAFFAGYIYLKLRRLLSIMVLHYLADLPLAIVTLVMAIRA